MDSMLVLKSSLESGIATDMLGMLAFAAEVQIHRHRQSWRNQIRNSCGHELNLCKYGDSCVVDDERFHFPQPSLSLQRSAFSIVSDLAMQLKMLPAA
jgi:hypothetical protein